MPNRIIKETICTSDTIDSLTDFEEVVFYRLIVNCDDFGRFDARAKVLSSKLFPLKSISPAKIQDAINALCAAGLISLYIVDDRPYLQVTTWDKHQSKRAKRSKYPSPDESNCKQMISDDVQVNADAMQMISDDENADASKCMHMISNASKCSRIRESRIENRESYSDACTREDTTDGDGEDERPRTDTVEAYALNNLSTLGYRAMQELADFINDLSGDIVRHAIDNALDKGVRNWSYVRAILNSYVDHDVKNIADAKAVDERRKKGGSRDSPDNKADYDEDHRPRAVIPDPSEVDYVKDENDPMGGLKMYVIRRSGEEVPYSTIQAMCPGEIERFWDSKRVRWRN